ncbi:hypothetical protein NMY22_g6788 [Coprinellus aureogranulatus]|nr:hypothetical protein NMY22_g6788 [Coprinellus aureogranulatus]
MGKRPWDTTNAPQAGTVPIALIRATAECTEAITRHTSTGRAKYGRIFQELSEVVEYRDLRCSGMFSGKQDETALAVACRIGHAPRLHIEIISE